MWKLTFKFVAIYIFRDIFLQRRSIWSWNGMTAEYGGSKDA
jgi:hypothetical protein